jgi:hypothetical protein
LRRVLHAGNHTLAHLEIERAQRCAASIRVPA